METDSTSFAKKFLQIIIKQRPGSGWDYAKILIYCPFLCPSKDWKDANVTPIFKKKVRKVAQIIIDPFL